MDEEGRKSLEALLKQCRCDYTDDVGYPCICNRPGTVDVGDGWWFCQPCVDDDHMIDYYYFEYEDEDF